MDEEDATGVCAAIRDADVPEAEVDVEEVGLAAFEEVGLTKKIVVGEMLEIVCGASRLVMEAGGKVTIEGTEFLFKASGPFKMSGDPIDLN